MPGDDSSLPTPPRPTRKPSATSNFHNKNLRESFAHAFEGLSHVIWTQRHVRIQFTMVILVFVLSFVMKLPTTQFLFVLSGIMAVLIAELFNTAIEVVVNMITETYHPLAKIAKDVAAAGVLIASMYALTVGAVIFLDGERLRQFLESMPALDNPALKPFLTNTALIQNISKPNPIAVVVVAIVVVSLLVPLAKVRVGHGTLLRGGAVSGHSAVAFMLFALITIYSSFNPLISILALFLALLVAQSRVEGKIHTAVEVFWGAVVALVLITLLVMFSPPT